MQHHYDNIFYNSFKYLSFRKKAAPVGCFFCILKDGMRTLEGFVIAQRSAKQRIPAFCESDLLSSICKIYTQYYTQKRQYYWVFCWHQMIRCSDNLVVPDYLMPFNIT